MLKDVMGVIYTGENDANLRELTMMRAIAALPVAGRYRVVDFLLSSMVNAGIRNVGVIMQKNYHSLMDHLGSGKEWDLHGKHDGLYVLPPFLTRENVGVYSGTLDALRSNTNYLSRSKQEYVVLCNSSIICNPHMDQFIQFHMDTNADVTLMYTREESMLRDEMGTYIQVADDGRVTDMEVDPTHPTHANTFMEILILKRDYLRDLVDKGVAHGHHELSRDVLMPMVRDGNMDVLDAEVRSKLFADDLPVYTKIRDEMPARYGENAMAVNSLVADGCIIEGTVENSILFRGVRIAPDAHVKNCIIMQDGQVHSNAYIENCILDKQAVIKRNARLIGPNAYPIVIAKNVVI